MSEKKKSWIESLYQQSWEMELLISGFVIVLLVGVIDSPDFVFHWIHYHIDHSSSVSWILGITLVLLMELAIHFLILLMIVNLFFRGYWIALIGLLSATKETSNELDLSHNQQQRKIQLWEFSRLQKHTNNVDRLGSQCFAVAVLFTGYVFSFSCLTILIALADALAYIEWLFPVSRSLISILIGSTLLFLFDIFFFGIISNRKSRWINIPYAYFYRVYRLLSGYFLYEKIAIRFHSKGYLKKLNVAFIGISGLMFVAAHIASNKTLYDYPVVKFGNYPVEYRIIQLDEVVLGTHVSDIVVEQETISSMPIKVMIPLSNNFMVLLQQFCELEKTKLVDSNCINQVFKIKLDEQEIESPFWSYSESEVTPSKFVVTRIDQPDLARGRHLISVKLANLPDWQKANIWYYPENN